MEILLLGFLIGMRHAFEADHFSAVAALAARNTSLNSLVKTGAIWGLGHTLTLFAVGLIVLSFGVSVPETFTHALELLVGILLIALGVDLIWRLKKERIHIHKHRHSSGEQHIHVHSHKDEPASHIKHAHQHPKASDIRSLLVGSIHGLAGSGALIVLTLGTVESYSQGLLYIAIFGAGSIAGMVALSTAISVPIRLASKNLPINRCSHWLGHGLKGTIGFATITVGCLMAYEHGTSYWATVS